MSKTNPKYVARLRRKAHIRKTVRGTEGRPRLCVHRGDASAAALVGKKVGERALAAGVTAVAFDRNGFLYHGRVKALADGAREAGLQF